MKKLVFLLVTVLMVISLAGCSSKSGNENSDVTPPVISAVSAPSVTSTGATITWTTDEMANSQVEYGLTTSYGSSTSLDSNMVTAHSVSLTGLTSQTPYHYRVKSADGSGNSASSADHTLTTLTESQQWAAYAFGDTVQPASGAAGTIKSFTIDSVDSSDNKVREFTIEGTYLGKETTQIVTQKMTTTSTPPYYETENITTSMECYKVKHHVTVVKDETGDTHPAWADVTLWIPTDNFQTTTSYFWIYPKATYVDSDNNTGSWSYYLTSAMQSEMQNPPAGTTVTYLPIVDGDFKGYDSYAFYGLYGWGWFWFQGFAEGGQQHLQVASWTAGGCSYNCAQVNKTIGGYTFSAWSLDASCTYQGSSGGYKGMFSHDLPLPIYLKVGSTSGGSSNYFEYTLTDLQLQ